MPITARLSHRLHDTLGEDAGGDLVTWMQSVDTSRTELRELNELNFARLDARFRENDALLDARFRENDARLDARFREIDARFHELEARVDARFHESEARVDAQFAQVYIRFAQVDTRFAQLERVIERQYARLLAWSFGFWATALVALYAFTRGIG